jgi:hypothetical protein
MNDRFVATLRRVRSTLVTPAKSVFGPGAWMQAKPPISPQDGQ